jgi:hypothetical protein
MLLDLTLKANRRLRRKSQLLRLGKWCIGRKGVAVFQMRDESLARSLELGLQGAYRGLEASGKLSTSY